MTDINQILAERGVNYGAFHRHAEITQDIKAALRSGKSWEICSDAQKEALDMIAHKMGRIVNGNPNYVDSWTDIVGYSKLAESHTQDMEDV